MGLEEMNSSLKQQLKKIQERLDDMTNTQETERAVMKKALADKSQQVIELTARNAELEKGIKENCEITLQLDNSEGMVSVLRRRGV